MGKKIFVVNSGCYSDYGVDALFSTREKAEEFMRFVKGSEYNEIRTMDLDPPIAKQIKDGFWPWDVLMLKNGKVEKTSRADEVSTYSTTEHVWVWERSAAPSYKGQNIPDCLDATVMAKSEKHAVKIVNEKRVQMIANGEWK